MCQSNETESGGGFPNSLSHTAPITQLELRECMENLADKVEEWPAGSFAYVRLLQEAPRCSGRVDEMQVLVAAPGAQEKSWHAAAVKTISKSWMKLRPRAFEEAFPYENERPWHDVGILSELNRRNFPYACDLRGIFRDDANVYVAMSLATEGDLFSWSSGLPKPGTEREKQLHPIATQVCIAVRWLHDLGIAHRDISVENIVLTKSESGELQVKLIDFGMSAVSRKSSGSRWGKQPYKAPEIHTKSNYDAFRADAFSVGVVLCTLAAMKYPWWRTLPHQDRHFAAAKRNGIRRFLSTMQVPLGQDELQHATDVFTCEFMQVLEGLMHLEPAGRMTLGEACYTPGAHPSVRTLPWLLPAAPRP